jgi:two-component system copper resistance phosphate regulon response regulator CusR
MRLLLVEDEHKAGEYIQKGLTESGFVVDWASNGPEGLHAATTNHYDLIVLDVMLPGMDGWQIVTELRKTIDVPVLFLTARDALNDRIKGLELGADDYLVKPFAFAELLIRIRTLLRRGPIKEPEIFQIADLELDVPKRRVTRWPAYRSYRERVRAAALDVEACRPSFVSSINCFAGLGYELRQRYQCG